MKEFIEQLSKDLGIIKIEEDKDKIIIYCESLSKPNKTIHSRVTRIVKDIPFGDKKVELHLFVKKYFNDDETIDKLTIIEKFDFLNSTKRRTKRLEQSLINLSKEMSAIELERYIKENYADVSDSTVLRIIKKNYKSK